MTLMVIAISFFYYKNTQDNFQKQMKEYEKEYYFEVKESLKTKINLISDILDYNLVNLNLDINGQKEYAAQLLNSLKFEQNRSNYFFVYEILDFKGGDNFAKMLVNPNRPDLKGELISSNEEDINGKKFREEFLKNIINSGESYTTYSYKKPNSDGFIEKLSYFKLYSKFNWVIAVGIYMI